MAHEIFISYSSKHRDLTRRLAHAIETQYGPQSVWWDHELESRIAYAPQITAALENARVVVVLWTAGALVSDYVYAEATRAREAGKLVNVRPLDTALRDIPEPFNIYHMDVAEDFERILTTIAKVMAGTSIPTRVPLHEIYFRQHGYRIIDPKRSLFAQNPAEMSPTELLQARFEVVPFVDVNDKKAQIIEWCTNPSRLNAGQLVHGPGGLGKTRLMIDVATTMRAHGWTAGFLNRAHERENTLAQHTQAVDQLLDHTNDAGLMIVMDYAEGRSEEIAAIARRLANRSPGATRPIRLILLARSAGDWWSTLHAETPDVEKLFRSDARAPDVTALPSIASSEQRLAMFFKSLEAFAPFMETQGFLPLNLRPSAARLRRIETGMANARPLAIQMEALLYLTSGEPETEASADVDTLLRRILGVEREYWKKVIGRLDEEANRDLRRAVAQLVLLQGVGTRSDLETLLLADEFYRGRRTARVDVDVICSRITKLYGQSNGAYVHLEPDLVGEHHVALFSDVELLAGCFRWVGEQPEERQPFLHLSIITVLQRATQPEHGDTCKENICNLISYVLREHTPELAQAVVEVMSTTQGELKRILENEIKEMSVDSLRALDAALPFDDLRFIDLALVISAHLVAILEAYVSAIEEQKTSADTREFVMASLAVAQGQFGIRLSNIGFYQEAANACRRGVEVYRQLSEDTNDRSHRYGLALALIALSNRLGRLGEFEQEVGSAAEAVTILKGLVKIERLQFLPDLANSLNTFAGACRHFGMYNEAADALYEAISYTRQLNLISKLEDSRELSALLSNLAVTISDILGRAQFRDYKNEKRWQARQAISFAEESVNIARHPVQDNPTRDSLKLAWALSAMALVKNNIGNRDGALTALIEVEAIYEELNLLDPDAVADNIAENDDKISRVLLALKRPGEAIRYSETAVKQFRELAEVERSTFAPSLSNALSGLAQAYLESEKYAEAAEAAREALTTIADHVERFPSAHEMVAGPTGVIYVNACEKGNLQMDMPLMERVAKALGWQG